MTRIPVIVGLLACIVFAGPVSAEFSVDSAALSMLEFPAPNNPDAQKYLGISKTGNFKLSDVPAELLIVEVFSMYCPYCQADAPNVNELYKVIQGDPGLQGKIRIIGIGTGNTPFEVEVFRKKYNVQFPLFSDEGFAVQKISSEPIRTPLFIALGKKADKSFAVHYMHIGESKEPGPFLKKVLAGRSK